MKVNSKNKEVEKGNKLGKNQSTNQKVSVKVCESSKIESECELKQ